MNFLMQQTTVVLKTDFNIVNWVFGILSGLIVLIIYGLLRRWYLKKYGK